LENHVGEGMIFKSCYAQGIEMDGDEAWFYVVLSSPIKAINDRGMYDYLSYVIVAEKILLEGGYVTVVMGCYDEDYQDMNPTPIIDNILNGGDVMSIMKGLGYEWQEDLI